MSTLPNTEENHDLTWTVHLSPISSKCSLRWSFLYVPLLLTPKYSRLVKRWRARQQMLTFKWAHKPESRLTLQQSCPRTNLGASNTCLPCDKARSLLRWESTLSLSRTLFWGYNRMPPHTLSNRQSHRSGLDTTEILELDFQMKSAQVKERPVFHYKSIIPVNLQTERSFKKLVQEMPKISSFASWSVNTLSTRGSIDIIIIISTLFLQFAPCASGCGWCIVDDGCVSCRPSEVLMMSLLPQPGYGTGAVSRPG